MKILYICNNAYIPGNGISTSARNITRKMRDLGEEVRIMSVANPDPNGKQPDYPLKKFYFPLFQPIIDANGFCYAQIDRKLIREAVSWADIVHLEEPMFLQRAVLREAEKQKKTITATFHIYTQNIFMELPWINFRLTNHWLMRRWVRNFYNHCTDIQCPSNAVKELLEEYGVKARLHVISNGIKIPCENVIAKEPQKEPILILSIARLAAVKNQSLLLQAMKYSKHAHEIQLYFAGKGQLECKYRKEANRLVSKGILTYKPVFAFHSKEELKEISSRAYLYIHTAKLEVEGLGCIEAMREGTVPVIAKGSKIATSDFALDERSTFDVNDPQALAARIDYWIEHPEERDRMAQLYADHAREYSLNKSAKALIKMYNQALGNQE